MTTTDRHEKRQYSEKKEIERTNIQSKAYKATKSGIIINSDRCLIPLGHQQIFITLLSFTKLYIVSLISHAEDKL